MARLRRRVAFAALAAAGCRVCDGLSWERPIEEPPALVFVTITKGEAPYVSEWVEYHALLGVDQFVLLSNECDDAADAAFKARATRGGRRDSATLGPPGGRGDGRRDAKIMFVDDYRCAARGFQRRAYQAVSTELVGWLSAVWNPNRFKIPST